MIDFGDPLNPFGEADREAAYVQSLYTLPGCLGRLQVKYMAYHMDEAIEDHESATGSMIRTLRMDCHAPFSSELNAFLNPYAEIYRQQDRIGYPTREAVHITMGDLVVNNEVVRRWARLDRSDGSPFGICGVSREIDGALEVWGAMTISYGLIDGAVDLEFWGECVDSPNPQSERICESDGRAFEAHIESIYRAMLRRLNKEFGSENV